MKQLRSAILILIISLLQAPVSNAAVISKTIVVDGTFTDWTAPTDITSNSGQFASDPEGKNSCPTSTDRDSWTGGDVDSGTCSGLPGGVGRDLSEFSFTYDTDNLYLFVRRFASSTNVTDWWFYIDVDNDGLMETSDIVYRVNWQGSNQNTNRELWSYTPSITGGDVLVSPTTGFADGYDMPGTISNRQVLSAFNGGSGTGLMMETFLPWSTLCGIGCSPQSVRFHISSSNGSNLPNNIVDNMDGPGGSSGAIVILDLNVDKVASLSETVGGGPNFTYTLTVTNEGGGNATGVSITDALPPGVSYVSDNSASTGTTFTDTGDAGSDPDLWAISNLNDGQSISLIITVSPDVVGSNTVVSNTASQLTLNESDTDSSNNSDSVDVIIRPTPDLTITKAHSSNFTVGLNESWTINVANEGAGDHTGIMTVTDSLQSGLTFVAGTGPNWSCSAIGQNVTCDYSAAIPGGSGSTPLTLTVNVGSGAIGSFNNVVNVTAGVFESNTGNNAATDPTFVVASGNLQCYATATDGSSIRRLFKIDSGAFFAAASPAATNSTATHLAYNCATGVLYGIRNGNQLATVNPGTGAFTDIGSGLTSITTVTGLAFDATTGGLFGTRRVTGGAKDDVFQIDPSTGDLVANAFGLSNDFLEIDPANVNDLAFDSVDGELLTINNGSQIASVNGSTGAATNLPVSLSPVTDMINLSSDNAGVGSTIGTNSGNTVYFINTDGSTGSSGNVSGITAFHGLDCKYACSPKLLDINITKTATDKTPLEGDQIGFALVVTNNGPSQATALQIIDQLPAGLTYVSDTPSQGGYDNLSGEWYIGNLNSGGSATLSILVDVTGTVGNTYTNTANLAFVTQVDTNGTNNSSSVDITPVRSDISTSTKQVVDLNGGQPAPGDKLRYTITLIETGGTNATSVSVRDDTPATTGSLTLVSFPPGATNNSGLGSFDVEFNDISVPANSSIEIIFDVTISASANGGDIISNIVSIVNASGLAPASDPAAPDVTVVRNAAVKQLYAGPVGGETINGLAFPSLALGRLPFTSTAGITINGGASQSWTLSPALTSSLTLDGSSSIGGVSVPIQLVLSRGNSGNNRSVQASLGYQPGCSGGVTNIGTTANSNVLSGTGPVAETISFNLTGDVIVPSNSCLVLTVNNTESSSNKTINVHPTSSGSNTQIDLGVFTVINVDSVSIHSAPGGASPISSTAFGSDVYLRAIVSDPFGAYDISSVDVAVRDNTNTLIYTADPMSEDSRSAGSITFEQGPVTISSGAEGLWSVYVTADEGTEGTIEHQNVNSFTVISQPNLTVVKTATPTTATPGDLITYDNVILNAGPGKAHNVIVFFKLGDFSSLNVVYGGAVPLVYADGVPTSDLTAGTTSYSDDNGISYVYGPLVGPYDPDVTDIRVEMNGIMTIDGTFSFQYQMKVE